MALGLLLVCSLVGARATKPVLISNVLPRHNVSGHIMDAHDGSYSQWSPQGPW